MILGVGLLEDFMKDLVQDQDLALVIVTKAVVMEVAILVIIEIEETVALMIETVVGDLALVVDTMVDSDAKCFSFIC